MLRQILLLSTLAAAVVANDIVWQSSCPPEIKSLNFTLPITCGSLSVPLDYTDLSSDKRLDLLLYKVPVAAGRKSEHSVLLNFGGPGNDGLSMFASFASDLQLILGEDHDMILVNPRGSGANFNFSCSQNAAEAVQQGSWTTLVGNASDVAQGEIWAENGLYAQACKKSPGATNGDLIGTAFTARDFMQVAEALHEDDLIYYQGFSYGTVLGMTIAALFPDKVGRMVLDGNVNVQQYYQGSYVDYYPQADEVFSIFCSTCIKAPQLCPLAHNQSSAELENELLALFERLKYHPLPVSFPDGSGALVDYSFVVENVYASLYESASWPDVSQVLAELLAGNTTLLTKTTLTPPGPDALSGVRCGDNRIRVSDPNDLNSVVTATESKSPIFGGRSVSLYYTCAQWPFLAKGNFSWPACPLPIRTKEPVLLIGNEFDPVTPLANAKANAADLEGSVVLQNDGVGHTTFLTQGSLCTAKAYYSYWRNGTLPQPGTSCPTEGAVFSTNNGWAEVFQELRKEIGGSRV